MTLLLTLMLMMGQGSTTCPSHILLENNGVYSCAKDVEDVDPYLRNYFPGWHSWLFVMNLNRYVPLEARGPVLTGPLTLTSDQLMGIHPSWEEPLIVPAVKKKVEVDSEYYCDAGCAMGGSNTSTETYCLCRSTEQGTVPGLWPVKKRSKVSYRYKCSNPTRILLPPAGDGRVWCLLPESR